LKAFNQLVFVAKAASWRLLFYSKPSVVLAKIVVVFAPKNNRLVDLLLGFINTMACVAMLWYPVA
jgi:hypothetical protein